MIEFKKIESSDDIKKIIKSVSDMDLDVEGLWGYDKQSATQINSVENFSLNELELLLCSLRAHIQMSMTLSQEQRYASITPTEISRESIIENDIKYDKVIYEIGATKELEFKNLIQEYKDNHGDENFDLEAHFKKREDSKIIIQDEYWFIVTKVS